MKICLDIQCAIGRTAGIGRYTRTLAEHLAPLAGPGDSLALFYFDWRRRGKPFQPPGATLLPAPPIPGSLAMRAWKWFGWPPFDSLAGPADLYHFPNFYRPPLRRGRSVVSVHDLAFMRYPEFTESGNLRHLSGTLARTAARADALITISRFSAGEIIDLLGVEPSRIFHTPLGISPLFQPPPPEAVARFRAAAGLEGPYLLHVGTVEPRKNIPFLVDAFEQLTDYPGTLVLAGAPGWKVGPILDRLAVSPRAGRIRRLDYVAETDLPALYAGADAFLCPSHYEGFGLPPLEAMACGTPVLTSDRGSLPEVLAGGAAAVLAIDSPDRWAAAVRGLLADPAARAATVARGRAHAARFTWEETARQTWAVYRKVAAP